MMSKRSQILHQRVTPLIVDLIDVEQKARGGSAGDALERLIMWGAYLFPEGRAVVDENRKKQPLNVGLVIASERRGQPLSTLDESAGRSASSQATSDTTTNKKRHKAGHK